jgi:RNA polymerase sigma-32 factor
VKRPRRAAKPGRPERSPRRGKRRSEASALEAELLEDTGAGSAKSKAQTRASADSTPLDAGAPGALVPVDPLSRYMSELARYPLLSPKEERRLARRAQRGDREAAQKLVLSNLRLVVKIAMDYRRVWTQLLDLIQEGNVGLLRAVERFDPERGVKLSSYAAYWIRAYILKHLIDNIRLVRMGQSRAERKLFFQLSRVRRELEREGLEPEPRLIAERLDVKEGEVIDMERRLSQGDLSLDAPTQQDPESPRMSDFVSSQEPSAEDVVAEQDQRTTLLSYVEKFATALDERDTAILRERVLADPPKTLQEIGDRFDLTRERVRQLEKALVARLREYLEKNLVDFEYWAPEDR